MMFDGTITAGSLGYWARLAKKGYSISFLIKGSEMQLLCGKVVKRYELRLWLGSSHESTSCYDVITAVSAT